MAGVVHDCNLRTSFHIDFMHAPVQIGYCTILPSFPLISSSLPTTALRRNFTSDAVEHSAYQWLNVIGLNLHNVVHRIVFKLCAFRTQRCVPCCGIARTHAAVQFAWGLCQTAAAGSTWNMRGPIDCPFRYKIYIR